MNRRLVFLLLLSSLVPGTHVRSQALPPADLGNALRLTKSAAIGPGLSWVGVSDATSYDIRRCEPPAGAGCTPLTIAVASSSPFTDAGADALAYAWYIAAPRNACGATPPDPNDPPTNCARPARPVCGERYDVTFSTYFGQGDSRGVTSDAQGNIYIAGGGNSTTPTTPGAYQRTVLGRGDVSVAKFAPDGSLVWSTLLGGDGEGDEYAYTVKVDGQGYVYVCGRAAPNFPTTPGVLQPAYQGNGTPGVGHGMDDGFVAKLTPDGSGLVWATYFGTAQDVRDCDVDAAGNVYVSTWYDETAGQAPFDPAWFTGGFRSTRIGGSDAVVAKINSTATQVLWATYLGGTRLEPGRNSVRVAPSGHVYHLTATASTDCPVPNGYQTVNRGPATALVSSYYLVKILPDGSDLAWGTYFGGSEGVGIDSHQLAVDGREDVFICGGTRATDFPTTPGAFQTAYGGTGTSIFEAGGDAVIAKFSSDGALLASTYFGGNNGDVAFGLAVDADGNLYASGGTVSTNLPLAGNPFQAVNLGYMDYFAAKFSPDLSRLLYASYIGTFGGSSFEMARSCWADSYGFYVTGTCPQPTWPLVNPYDASEPGGPVLVKWAPSAPGNQPPAVDAGPDQTLTLPTRAALHGTMRDDCLPDPPAALTGTWSQVSGPGAAVFADPAAADTLASLPVTGVYVLRLTADDGQLQSVDDVTVSALP